MEDFSVASQGLDSFLDASTARVVETDAGSANESGLVHNFAYLFGVGFRKRATIHSEVLREGKDNFSVDGALASNHTISVNVLLVHSKVGAPVSHQLVVLNERALVKEKFDALASSQLVVRVLLVNSSLSASQKGLFVYFLEALSESFLLQT